MYQSLEIAFRRRTNHAHEATGLSGLLNLFLSIAFVVVANSRDMRVVGRRSSILKFSVVDEDNSRIGVVFEIKGV